MAAPGLVVTNAHVVAGMPGTCGAGRHDGAATEVVLFDPAFDLAVLRVAGLSAPTLHLDPPRSGGAPRPPFSATRGAARSRWTPAGVMAEFEAQGRDIYGRGLTVRNVYELDAVVRPGNSGGPLVLPDGQVVGVVFSRPPWTTPSGYALTSPDVLPRVARAEVTSQPVSTGGCAPS